SQAPSLPPSEARELTRPHELAETGGASIETLAPRYAGYFSRAQARIGLNSGLQSCSSRSRSTRGKAPSRVFQGCARRRVSSSRQHRTNELPLQTAYL